MTPPGRGHFLGPDGEVIDIFEHLAAVEEDPERFGLRPEDVHPRDIAERRNREERRRRVLTQVLKNGFVRARFTKRRRVCEFWASNPEEERRRMAIIEAFLAKEGIKDCVIRNVNGRAAEED